MRILYLNPVAGLGGAEQSLLTAIAGVRRKWPLAELRLITGAAGPLVGRAEEAGAAVEVLPMPAGLRELGDSAARGRGLGGLLALAAASTRTLPAVCNYLCRLRAAVRRAYPDLVHSNGIKCHLLTRAVVPRGIPVVWWAQDFYGQRPLAGRLLRLSRGRCRLVLAISRAIAEDAANVLPGVPVAVLPHAVDLARFSPGEGDGGELDRRAGLPIAPEGTMRVGLVATYARWKGHLTVLEAAAKLLAEQPTLPVRWYLVGGPIYHTTAQFTVAELREAVAARGLGEVVGFVPFTDNPVAVYRSLDIVVHASTLPEPFGLTIAEAMACGRAVIVSQAGGAAELFTDGIDALGVPPGDVQSLANAVRKLAANGEWRDRLGVKARASAVERFDAAHYGEKLLEVYRTIMNAAVS